MKAKILLLVLLTVLLAALPAQADVILPEGTVEIEERAFMNDTRLTGTLIVPAGVQEIDAESFRNCTGLTGITFTDTPVIIDSLAFAGCTGLAGTTVYVPKGSTIAADAFDSTVTIVIAGLDDYPPVVPSMIQPEHTTLTIYDWWSGDGDRDLYPDEIEQKNYDYHDWIESTYNVKIVQKTGGDWTTNAEEMINFTSAPDDSLRMYIIEPGRVGSLVANGIAASWGNYDLSAPKWNKGTIDLWTMGGQHYGVSVGAHEPRALVYFNKRLLEEAGIDWNSIYDMQAAGTWTTIYDWWSGDGDRDLYPDEIEQKNYDYHDWIESTYNVKIVQKTGGDWTTNAEEMINFTSAPDDSLRMYIIEPGRVGSLVANGIAASWGNYDLSAPKWNKGTIDLWTMGGQHYGVSVGAHEPRALVYFNKRLLEEAGIDWNSIYDMQAAGTWTWSAFESMLKKTTLDTDNDGVIDIWGVSGSSDYMYLLAVLGNGGSFFDFDSNGKLQPTMDSAASMAALNWAKEIQNTYWMLQPEDANWDWYKEAWKEGKFTFYINEAYCGFNAWSEMRGMEDEWGAVAFPVPSAGSKYITNPSENTALIPNVYDAETVQTIAFFYDLWTNDAPGVNSGDSWRSGKYALTDKRAVDETYAMLRKASHGVADKFVYLGTQNDILGASLLWQLADSSPAELIEAAMPAWQALCDTFNSK